MRCDLPNCGVECKKWETPPLILAVAWGESSEGAETRFAGTGGALE